MTRAQAQRRPVQGKYVRLTEISPGEDRYTLNLVFDDGESGIVDVSDIATSHPAFSGWKDMHFFQQVSLDEYGTPFWGDELDLSPDLLYCRLTGLSPADIAPKDEDEALKTLKSRIVKEHKSSRKSVSVG